MPGKLTLLALIVISSATASGRTIHVPVNQSTIQAGIDAAADGDTIWVAEGTYTGDGNRDLDFGGKAIVLISEGGPEETIIDCQADPEDRRRGFVFRNQEDSNAVVDGFTVINGYAPTDGPDGRAVGGALFCDSGSTPTIRNCVFTASKAIAGSAVCCYKASPTYENCHFRDNLYASQGGGLFLDSASVSLVSCDISRNTALFGGGVCCRGAEIIMKECVVDDNFTDYTGGGIHLDNSTAEIRRSTFCQNQAREGGAIHGGSLTADSCRFVGNSASEIGGVINESDAELNQTVLVDNTAVLGGACSYGSTVSLSNCTLYGNASPGGLFLLGGQDLSNCIITATSEGLLFVESTPVITCTDIFGNREGDWVGGLEELKEQFGNFTADPRFCDSAARELSLWYHSPCLPDSSGCGLVGALGAGCIGDTLPIPAYIKYTDSLAGNPVRTLTPEVFWMYLDTLATSQISYEIQVGNDDDWAVPELWSSGQVMSGNTSTLYNGTPLEDRQTYYVRIRVEGPDGWGSWRKSKFYTRLVEHSGEQSDWPTFQYNVTHTGYNDKDQISWPLELRWSGEYHESAFHQPTVVGDKVFLSTWLNYYSSVIVCLDENSGSELWRHGFSWYTNGDCLSQVTVFDELAYLQVTYGYGSRVYEYDAQSGAEIWEYPFRSQSQRYLAPTTHNRKMVIAGGTYGGMYCFDIDSREQVWRRGGGGSELWTVSIFHDTVFVYQSGYIGAYALNWDEYYWVVPTFEVEAAASPSGWTEYGSAPIIDTLRRILVAKHDRQITGLDMGTQQILWKREGFFADFSTGVNDGANGIQPCLVDSLVFAVDSGQLVALDVATGNVVWTLPEVRQIQYHPVAANRLLFLSSDSATFVMEIDTREIMWECSIGGRLAIANNCLYIATKSGELYVYGPTPTAVDDRTAGLPLSLDLGQNYPNPFNPTTTIEFSLPRASYVDLRVYNILGREVTTLLSADMAAGDHSVVWDSRDRFGRQVASGIYFYRLMADGFVESRKMLLLK